MAKIISGTFLLLSSIILSAAAPYSDTATFAAGIQVPAKITG